MDFRRFSHAVDTEVPPQAERGRFGQLKTGLKMDGTKAKTGPRCPICEAATDVDWRPFCSKRCADIDLGRWMTGRYAIPADEAPGGDADEN